MLPETELVLVCARALHRVVTSRADGDRRVRDLPAELGGGRLLLIHEVPYQGRRYYMYRFVTVDPSWRIDRVSLRQVLALLRPL
jgi:hypothetical protein